MARWKDQPKAIWFWDLALSQSATEREKEMRSNRYRLAPSKFNIAFSSCSDRQAWSHRTAIISFCDLCRRKLYNYFRTLPPSLIDQSFVLFFFCKCRLISFNSLFFIIWFLKVFSTKECKQVHLLHGAVSEDERTGIAGKEGRAGRAWRAGRAGRDNKR